MRKISIILFAIWFALLAILNIQRESFYDPPLADCLGTQLTCPDVFREPDGQEWVVKNRLPGSNQASAALPLVAVGILAFSYQRSRKY